MYSSLYMGPGNEKKIKPKKYLLILELLLHPGNPLDPEHLQTNRKNYLIHTIRTKEQTQYDDHVEGVFTRASRGTVLSHST